MRHLCPAIEGIGYRKVSALAALGLGYAECAILLDHGIHLYLALLDGLHASG